MDKLRKYRLLIPLVILVCFLLLVIPGLVDSPPPLLHENPEMEAQLYADVRQRTQTLPGGESLNQGYVQWKSYVIFIVRHYFMEGMSEDLDYVYKWDGRAWLFVERWQWRTHIYRRDA